MAHNDHDGHLGTKRGKQLGNLEAGQVEEVPRRVLRQQLRREWHKLVGEETAPDSERSDAHRRR